MHAYRADRVVRTLATLISIAYFVLMVLGILVLVATPALKLFGGHDSDWRWGLEVPAVLNVAQAPVATSWGAARLEVEEVRARLRMPIAAMPWTLLGVLWAQFAVAFALTMLFLHHLRRILQRARDGAPFDPQNAFRLRRLGFLLLGLALLQGVAEVVTILAVRSGLESADITVPLRFGPDGSMVLIALVLIALAEVFRRGAELEHEQSLVV